MTKCAKLTHSSKRLQRYKCVWLNFVIDTQIHAHSFQNYLTSFIVSTFQRCVPFNSISPFDFITCCYLSSRLMVRIHSNVYIKQTCVDIIFYILRNHFGQRTITNANSIVWRWLLFWSIVIVQKLSVLHSFLTTVNGLDDYDDGCGGVDCDDDDNNNNK